MTKVWPFCGTVSAHDDGGSCGINGAAAFGGCLRFCGGFWVPVVDPVNAPWRPSFTVDTDAAVISSFDVRTVQAG